MPYFIQFSAFYLEWKSWLETQHSKNKNHPVPSLHANILGNNGNSDRRIFLGSIITANSDCSHEVKRCLLLGRKAMTNLDSILKSRDIILPTKVHLVKAMVFPVVMYGWELGDKESWASKNWCFWTVVLKKTLESPLDCKDVQPVHPKGHQSCIFIGRTDAEIEAPMLWPPDAKNWLIGKDPEARKDWGQEKKGMIENEMHGITDSVDMSLSELREVEMDREAWPAAVHGVAKSGPRLSNWTELKLELNLLSVIIYCSSLASSFGSAFTWKCSGHSFYFSILAFLHF